MKPLKFYQKYYKSIVHGVKTSTIRDEPKPYLIGEVVTAHFLDDGGNVACKLKLIITDITRKPFNRLNGDDAISEHIMNVLHLREVLKKIYPNLTDESIIYKYTFTSQHCFNCGYHTLKDTGENIEDYCKINNQIIENIDNTQCDVYQDLKNEEVPYE